MAREGTHRLWVGAGIALVAILAAVQTFGFVRDQHERAVAEEQRDELRRSYVAMFHLVRVPDVRGLPLPSARKILAGSMFYVDRIRPAAAGEDLEAVVIAQHPPPGSTMRADSPVTLTALTDWPRPYRYVRRKNPDGPVPVSR